MPRLRQVPRSEAPPEVVEVYDMLFGGRDPVAEPGTATGTPGNWWTVMALVPDVFRHCVAGFGLYRSSRRQLDPKLRELGQTRAGFARGSQFVFSQHCKAMRQVGLSEEQIAAIPAWSSSNAFSPVERAVLGYTDELVLQQAHAGVKRALIMSPAFVADCLETIEELGIRAAESFEAAGGERLELVPSLNARDDWADALLAIVRESTNWLGRATEPASVVR